MENSIYISLLITMPLMGIIFGLSFHLIVMPLFGSAILHCILSGLVFGIINYFIAVAFYKRFNELKSSHTLLQKENKIDKLTGLFNRRMFENTINEFTGKNTYSLIFIDIDNFRQFNNVYGHKIGDCVLKNVSQTIKNSVREDDPVFRYGGEEIVVFLNNCSKRDTYEIAEKIRLKVNQVDNSPYPPITISLGVSCCPEDGRTVLDVIEASDKALLTAKNTGKNKTVVCAAAPNGTSGT